MFIMKMINRVVDRSSRLVVIHKKVCINEKVVIHKKVFTNEKVVIHETVIII